MGIRERFREPWGQIPLLPWEVLILLTCFNLLNYLDRYLVSAIITDISKEFHLSDTEAGRISTAFMLGYFIVSPLFGYLGDRMSRKWLIAGGVFVWSLATYMSGAATGFVSLLIYRVWVGFGEASYGTISPAIITDVFPETKRNNALTIFYVAIPVGSAVGYMLGGFMASKWGWREAFHIAGLPGILLAVLFLMFKEPKRGESDQLHQSAHKIPSLADILAILKIRPYVLVVAGYCLYTFSLGAYAYWGPTFLERVHKVEKNEAALTFGIITVIAGLVGTFLGGFLTTWLRKRYNQAYEYFMGVTVLLTVPFSYLAFTLTDPRLVQMNLFLAVFMFFLPTGPINTLILSAVPSNLRASAMAISIFSIHMFGDMWSPEIVGRLSDSWQDLSKAMMVLPIFSGLAGLLWLYMGLDASKRQTN
jgi:MFS family permease